MVDVTKHDLNEYIQKVKEDLNDPEPTTITLEPWEEISGFFFGLEENEQWLDVRFQRKSLRVPQNSNRAKCLRRKLEEKRIQSLSIIRTESLEQPYRIQAAPF